MLARREEEYDYEPLVAEPAPQLEEAKEPLIRREVNTNLRNCLRALFFLIAFGAMVVTLLGGIGAKNGYTLLDTQQRADQLEQENERLKIEIAQMKSPERVRRIATEKLGMSTPKTVYFATGAKE